MGACMACFAVDICSCLACCACKACLSLLPQCTRLSLFSILFLTFLLAVILGKYFPERFNGHYSGLLGVKVASQCSSSDYINDCIYRQLVYRASLAMFLLFTLSSILAVSNFMNKSFMIIKFLIGVGAFIGFWWVDDTIFSNWAEVIRVFSFFWLVVQGLLLLDFAHDAHDLIIEETSTDNPDHNRGMYTLYSFTSLTALAAVVVGLVYLFRDYAGCSLGLFFTLLTLIVGVLCTIISLLNVVNRGMLTPLIMFAYSTFMCWYALTSSTDPGCNPSANSNNGSVETANIAVVCVVTLLVSLYVISQGSIVLNIFNPNAEGVMQTALRSTPNPLTYQDTPAAVTTQPAAAGSEGQVKPEQETPRAEEDDTGTIHERVLFSVIMALLACYCGMVLTYWGNSNGVPDSQGSTRVASESMWIKIVSQWVFLLMQIKALHVAYMANV